jgi:hypothetical protein
MGDKDKKLSNVAERLMFIFGHKHKIDWRRIKVVALNNVHGFWIWE